MLGCPRDGMIPALGLANDKIEPVEEFEITDAQTVLAAFALLDAKTDGFRLGSSNRRRRSGIARPIEG